VQKTLEEVLEESQKQVAEAEKTLEDVSKEDMARILSHYVGTILIHRLFRYVESQAADGVLSSEEAQMYLERLDTALVRNQTCCEKWCCGKEEEECNRPVEEPRDGSWRADDDGDVSDAGINSGDNNGATSEGEKLLNEVLQGVVNNSDTIRTGNQAKATPSVMDLFGGLSGFFAPSDARKNNSRSTEDIEAVGVSQDKKNDDECGEVAEP